MKESEALRNWKWPLPCLTYCTFPSSTPQSSSIPFSVPLLPGPVTGPPETFPGRQRVAEGPASSAVAFTAPVQPLSAMPEGGRCSCSQDPPRARRAGAPSPGGCQGEGSGWQEGVWTWTPARKRWWLTTEKAFHQHMLGGNRDRACRSLGHQRGLNLKGQSRNLVRTWVSAVSHGSTVLRGDPCHSSRAVTFSFPTALRVGPCVSSQTQLSLWPVPPAPHRTRRGSTA